MSNVNVSSLGVAFRAIEHLQEKQPHNWKLILEKFSQGYSVEGVINFLKSNDPDDQDELFSSVVSQACKTASSRMNRDEAGNATPTISKVAKTFGNVAHKPSETESSEEFGGLSTDEFFASHKVRKVG